MSKFINLTSLNALISKYENMGGGVYAIDGCLLDNYIMIGEGLKTIIIKEKHLNEWSSANVISRYNVCPKKYAKVIELLNNDNREEAEKLFFA